MKIRVSDYIASYLKEIGVKSVFLLSGGGMMHLIDALGRVENVDYYCNHHEQASAMAAEGYARQTNQLGVCYATSGPGATNIITGLVGAWLDSAPVLYITGQSNLKQTIQASQIPGLRQFGTFEVDIVPMVQSVTKYSVFIDDPQKIRYHLEKSVHLALSGRPGPVLIDIPLNIQGALIDPETLQGYDEPRCNIMELRNEDALQILKKIQSAERPIILAGHGIRVAGAVQIFKDLVNKLQIPVLTTQLGKDVLEYDNNMFVGHPGVKGDRAGNFAIQNADLILTLGCSLHMQTTGYELDKFAVNAYKIQVDMDETILSRENVNISQKVLCDVTSFIKNIGLYCEKWDSSKFNEWRQRCAYWKNRFAVIREPHKINDGPVNLYEFANMLSELLEGKETIVTDAGSAFYVMGQAFKIKGSQRYIVSGALGAMGYALPSSLGISTARPEINIICITGDGSLQTNIQELQTLRHYNMNVKVFVINNDGYVSIRNTQDTYFSGHYVGTSQNTGVSLPPLDKVADTYGIPYVECLNRRSLRDAILETMHMHGPVICGINSQSDQQIIPTVSSKSLESGALESTPLHDMFPFLDNKELNENIY